MEETVRAREAAREAIRDITPARLRDYVDGLLESSAVIPGVLTLLSARTVDGVGTAGVRNRAAGVQLIYEGLRLTRTLADEEPWREEPPHTESDIAILAADVMVARGFYLLARTEAADKAVETVQSFGRDRTDSGHARALEADVFELALVAGTTLADGRPPTDLRRFAEELATPDEEDAPEALPDGAGDELARFARFVDASRIDERPPSSATDP